MDVAALPTGGGQLLHELADLAQWGLGPWILLAPLTWAVARIAFVVVAGIDLRRTMQSMPPDVLRWEGSSALGRDFKIVRAGPGGAGSAGQESESEGANPPGKKCSATVEDFVRQHRAVLSEKAAKLMRYGGDAEDLLEDALVKLIEKWDTVAERPDVDKIGYLYTTMANMVKDMGRARSRFQAFAQLFVASSNHVLQSVEAKSADRDFVARADAELTRVIAKMPRQRAYIFRLHLADYSNAEIAGLTGKNSQAISMTITRARRYVVNNISIDLLDALCRRRPERLDPSDPPPDSANGQASEGEEGNR